MQIYMRLICHYNTDYVVRGMGCDRESRLEYDTTTCPRSKDKIKNRRVPDERDIFTMICTVYIFVHQ